MRVLIDILHPAHVHVFRHFRTAMLDAGHDVLVTARDKEVVVDLLEAYDIDHHVLSTQASGSAALARELVGRTARLVRLARRFRPDVLTGIMGPSIAPAGRLLRVPSVVFYDTELATVTNRWVYPLATAVVTPDSYAGHVRGNHITHPSYHELAYLHPDQFQPDPARLAAFGLERPYSLLRFVSWEASHDVGETGLSLADKLAVVEHLAAHGTVAVSSEGPLPRELEPYRLQGPAHDIHHVLGLASVVVGESGTMSSEAAVLGTPAVMFAPRGAGVFDDQEAYGILTRIRSYSTADALDAVDAAITDRSAVEAGHRRMLEDKVALTPWMVDFFEREAWRSR